MQTHRFWAILSLFLSPLLFSPGANGQTAKLDAPPEIRLRAAVNGVQPFELKALRGKVILIFHWRTDCPVCLDKMNEIRSNILGWRNKPFVMLAINHDKRRQDFQSYLDITKAIHGKNNQLIHLYGKDLAIDTSYDGERLPASFVLDREMFLKHSYIGRIPADAWDDIAELLP